MANTVSGVLMILAVIVVGFFTGKRGLVSEKNTDFLSNLVTKIAVPAMLFQNAAQNVTWDFLRETGVIGILTPFISYAVVVSVAFFSYKLFKIGPKDRGIFITMFSMSNTITVGLPIVMAIFGEKGIPYLTSYYIANTVVFWGICVPIIAADAGQRKKFGLDTVKAVFSPAIISFFIGSALSLSGIKLPEFIMSAASSVGSMVMPISLMLIGIVLSSMARRDVFRIERTGLLALIGRFFISPLVCILLCLLFRLNFIATGVFTVMSALPVMNQASIIARYYGANDRLTAQMLVVTSGCLLVVAPAIVLILTSIYTSA